MDYFNNFLFIIFFIHIGPIDNSDFLCPHGGVLPSKFSHVKELCVAFSQNAWNFLHSTFGGGPACSRLYECSYCKEELEALNRQKEFELETFKQVSRMRGLTTRGRL